jgi:hypothetical protein
MNRDIRLATSFKGHRKRKKLKRLLGFGAEVYLIDLWLTVAMDCPEGVLTGWNEEDIADSCDWPEEPKELVDALIGSGWLEKNSNGEYVLHDWGEHQGWACNANARSEAASKNILLRWTLKDIKKKDVEGFKKWYKSEYAYQKGHTSVEVLALYHSYTNRINPNTNRNTPSPLPSPLPSPTPTYDNNADSAASACNSSEEKFYTTKSGKKLTGKRLETFESFWRVFNFKNGKAAAADSWLKIPTLTDALVQDILFAAEIEASRRPELIKSGGSPKWAQGWLTERRWEDEAYKENLNGTMAKKTMVYEVSE